MLIHDNRQYLNLKELCQLLNRSTEAVRMLIQRNVIVPVKINSRLYFDAQMAQTFYAKKKGLPSLESSEEFKRGEAFFSLHKSAEKLGLGIESMRLKVRQKIVRAFCSVEGEIFIPQSVLNAYIEGQLHDFAKTV